MHRRTFIATAAATGFAGPVLASTGTPYTPGLVDKALADGKTVFLDVYTSWCSTCRAQGRAISSLRGENPAYNANILFVSLDWDEHSRSELAARLNIPQRSTLVALRGDQELGRIVAGTSKRAIKELLDTALSAATA